jgi:serine/threonine protein kinase
MLMFQGFARKVVRAQTATRQEIEQEVSAITALGHGAHEHLIQVLRHGWLDPKESLYFIDMELCDRNLSSFILEPIDSTPFICADHPEYLTDQDPPIWWRTTEIMQVNFQLVSGTEYIHRRNMVHRDLKPSNGISCFLTQELT